MRDAVKVVINLTCLTKILIMFLQKGTTMGKGNTVLTDEKIASIYCIKEVSISIKQMVYF